jgi:hypothetical protein
MMTTSSSGGGAMAAEPYSCRGQTTHPCSEHQNGGGGGARGCTAGAAPFTGPAALWLWLRGPLGTSTPWPRSR